MLNTWLLQDYADAAGHSSRMTMGSLATDPGRPAGSPVIWQPLMTLVRGAEVIGFVQVADASTLAQTLDMCITGYAPDVITVVVDTYSTNVVTNPRTGQPWGHNELGEYLLLNPDCNEDPDAEVFVSDALNIIAANRAGDLVSCMLPYRVTGREVRWNRISITADIDEDSLPAAIRDSMLRPTIEHLLGIKGRIPESITREVMSDDAEVRRANLDVSLTWHLTSNFHAQVWMDVTPGSRREETFQHFSHWREDGDGSG